MVSSRRIFFAKYAKYVIVFTVMARRRFEIRKTASGRFQARVSYQTRKYKQKKISKTFDLRRDAKAWAEQTQARLGVGLIKPTTKASDAFHAYLESRINMELRTRKDYKRTYSKFVQYARDPVLEQVSAELTSGFIASLTTAAGKPVSTTTRKYAYAHLRAAFRYAVKQAWIDRVPLGESPRARRNTITRDEVLTQDELKRFLEAAKADRETYPLILLLATTGMRLGEALALKETDIHEGSAWISKTAYDYDRNEIKIKETPKTLQSQRSVKLLPELLPYMRGLGQLFKVTRHRLVKAINKACIEANIKKNIKPHGLRHTATTVLLNKGVSVKVVSSVLGHSSTSFTLDTYAKFMKENEDDVPQTMLEILGHN